MKPSMIPRLNKVLKQRIKHLPEDIKREGEYFLDELLNVSVNAENNDLNMGDIFEQQTIRSLSMSNTPNDIYHKKAQAIRFMSGILPMERQAGVTMKLTSFFKSALDVVNKENLSHKEYEAYLEKIMSIYSHPGNRPEMALIGLQMEHDINCLVNKDNHEFIDQSSSILELISDCWAKLNPEWEPYKGKAKDQLEKLDLLKS